MAAFIYLDWTDDGRIKMTIYRGARSKPKETVFVAEARGDAERQAIAAMGRAGSMMSTLDMTPTQLADHRQREAAMKARLDALRPAA